jgi:uncharacterized protein YecE (DUF72 family)
MIEVRLGTSAFTAAGWPGTFKPKDLPTLEYLTYDATRFHTVEVDSTFYRNPALTTVIVVVNEVFQKRYKVLL